MTTIAQMWRLSHTCLANYRGQDLQLYGLAQHELVGAFDKWLLVAKKSMKANFASSFSALHSVD